MKHSTKNWKYDRILTINVEHIYYRELQRGSKTHSEHELEWSIKEFLRSTKQQAKCENDTDKRKHSREHDKQQPTSDMNEDVISSL